MFSNPSLRNYPEKLGRTQPFTSLLHLTRRQSSKQVCSVIAKVQGIPSPSQTHENQLRKFLACLASFITTTPRTATLHTINLQASFVPVTKKRATLKLTQIHTYTNFLQLFSHTPISPHPCHPNQLACSIAIVFHAFRKQVSGNTTKISFCHLSFYSNARETGQNPFYWKHI